MHEKTPSTVGDYNILRGIGEGRAGRVFLATPREHKQFARRGELVALKLYKDEVLTDPNERRRIQDRELKYGQQVQHPNVVRIDDYGEDSDGRPFLVMEYVDGQPLSSWVEMYHPIADSLLLSIVGGIVDGLGALHALDLVHRDLKPGNIMLLESFNSKVMDLGVIVPKTTHDDRFTPSDQFLGTIRNSSPELLQGKQYDHGTDLYSLGSVLYFLLHGEEVFAHEKQFVRLLQLVRDEAPRFDDTIAEEGRVRSHLLAICKSLLNKSPEKRPQSVGEIRSQVDELKKEQAALCRPLCAYMASALTGLTDRDREAITFMGHSLARACKTLNIYAHQPRKATDPILHSGISPEFVYTFDRRRIVSSDLAIVICNEPSFGVGQELEIIASYGIPTLLIKREGVRLSRMVTGGPLNLLDDTIEYQSPEDLEKKTLQALKRNLESLRQRKAGVAKNIGATIGQKVRELRESRGWSMRDAAQAYGVSPRLVAIIENNPDFYHNVGVVPLAQIASAHGMSVVDLVSSVPIKDLGGQVPEGINISTIEQVAIAERWSAQDLIELRDEYLRESSIALAARASLTKSEVHRRHEALAQRRLDDSPDFRLE